MSRKPLAALILAAGRGERMKSDLPKVLHEAAGRPLISHVLRTVREAGIKHVAVVVGAQGKELRSFLGNAEVVRQPRPLGTAHAVLQAERRFRNWRGDLLVLPADAPCLKPETLRSFIRAHQRNGRVASVLTAEVANPHSYGRILRTGDRVQAIREELDLTAGERAVLEVNSGIYLFGAPLLFQRLREVKKNAAKKEYYLTDVVDLLTRAGDVVSAHRIRDGREIIGVNSRGELAIAHHVLVDQALQQHFNRGVTILDPSQTVIAAGVKIGPDTVIHPFTWIDRDVVIGRRCEIGPFAKIRSGSRIGDGAKIGSFVEVVRSKIGKHTSVKHLTYLGDARVGSRVNVGAGTITANYDGRRKNPTVVGDKVSLGCHTVLVAPVRIGQRAKTGAGTVVTRGQRIPAGATVVGVPARVLPRKRKS